MFMRLFHLKMQSEKVDFLRSFYDAIVIPELQKIDGCLFAGLLINNTDITEGILVGASLGLSAVGLYSGTKNTKEIFTK